MKRSYLWVDAVACNGYGICAELLPEWITLDDWGYPIIDQEALPQNVMAHAWRAVDSCPTLALSLKDQPQRPLAQAQQTSRSLRQSGGGTNR